MDAVLVRVEKRIVEAEDIVSFELASADGSPLPPFSAGAHIDVTVAPGVVRQYSLCNACNESHRYKIAVLRDPNSRGGSVAVHDAIREGDILSIGTPRNLFPLVEAPRSLLFAGGIGITPLLCMAQRLWREGADFALHYCTRAETRTAFRSAILESPFAARVRFHVDDGPAEQKLDLDAVLDAEGKGTHLYVCGPGGFIEFVTNGARRRGWEQDRIHTEYFGAAPRETAGEMSFEVKIASTGKSIAVPAGLTVVQALQESGIDIPVSCEQGICGTCLTGVLDGVPDHRDQYLTDKEHAANDRFTPCCSRAKSRVIVLDL